MRDTDVLQVIRRGLTPGVRGKSNRRAEVVSLQFRCWKFKHTESAHLGFAAAVHLREMFSTMSVPSDGGRLTASRSSPVHRPAFRCLRALHIGRSSKR